MVVGDGSVVAGGSVVVAGWVVVVDDSVVNDEPLAVRGGPASVAKLGCVVSPSVAETSARRSQKQ